MKNPTEATDLISENHRAKDHAVRDLSSYEPVFLDSDVGDFNIPDGRK